MEYQRTNNLPLAEHFFLQACQICPTDPLVYNELGVLYYRTKVSGHAGVLGSMPSSLQEEYRAGGRSHTPSRVAPSVGRHQLNTARLQPHFHITSFGSFSGVALTPG